VIGSSSTRRGGSRKVNKRVKMIPDPIHMGVLPNSSENGASRRGATAKPAAYVKIPNAPATCNERVGVSEGERACNAREVGSVKGAKTERRKVGNAQSKNQALHSSPPTSRSHSY
jgi:hypothetical protein